MKSNDTMLLKIFLVCLFAHFIMMPFVGFVIPSRVARPRYQLVYLYQESKSPVVNTPRIRTEPHLPVVEPLSQVSQQKIGIPLMEQGYHGNSAAIGLPKTPLLTVENQTNVSWKLYMPDMQFKPVETFPSVPSIANSFAEPAGKTASGDFEITGPAGNRSILLKVLPEYPSWAEKENIEANVKIKIWVDKNGVVISASTVETSGYRQLDMLAEDALRKWKFSPVDHDINVWAIVRLKFRLQ